MEVITLKTLSDATAQQVFDQVATHLLTQNRKSMTPMMFGDENPESGNGCAYRGSDEYSREWGLRKLNGTKCAAGCLISDEEYDAHILENVNWTSLVRRGLVPAAHRDLIDSLQTIHDSKAVEKWSVELKELAHIHDLNLDAPIWKKE